MKLKKIAALALAGVMAVSMLAGCGDASSNNNNSQKPGEEEPEVPASQVVTLFNNGQAANNKAEVKFTTDSDFENDLAQIVSLQGGEFNLNDLEANLKAVSGETYDKVLTGTVNGIALSNLFKDGQTANVFYGRNPNTFNPDAAGSQWWCPVDGDSRTVLFAMSVPNVLDGEAAVRQAVAKMQDKVFSEMPATTLVKKDDADSDQNGKTPAGAYDPTKDNEKYYDYTYTGTAAVVNVTGTDHAPDYYVVCVITQTATIKTL